jgi:sugar lactone lactonase YvrE
MGSMVNSSASAWGNNPNTSNFQMWTGLPTCTQLGLAPTATTVQDYDCLVYVTFTPSAPGARQAQLKVLTANGSVYNFPLYGVGTGPQLAIDGGAPSTILATGLGTTAGIAVTQSNMLYIADPTNNRVVSCSPAPSCSTQGTVGTGLKGPMGVATDTAGNVYISDTGNNRVLKVNPVDGTQTVLGNYVWIPGSTCDGGSTTKPCPSVGLGSEPGASVSATTAPPQYAFKAPQGLAVDVWNNVYVADTGNSAVVEIPSNPQLGGAAPLLSYSGAPQFKNPVAVAVDATGNVYVADTKSPSGQIIKLPPGGGDLVTVSGPQYSPIGSAVSAPNGVAVDAAGNLYVSDATSNAVVEMPSSTGPGSTTFALNFPGIKVPSGVALDASGNLYVADTGNSQVLFDARTGPQINVKFGNVPQNLAAGAQPICSGTILSDGFNTGNTSPCVLTVTNIGGAPLGVSTPVTFGASLLTVPTGSNPGYTIANSSGQTACGATLPSGLTCTLTTTFTPGADTTNSITVGVNDARGLAFSPQLSLQANGEQPLVNIVLTSSLGLTPAAGGTDTITATVTQPHLNNPINTPTGTVTFTYVIDPDNANVNNCGTGGTVTSPLSGSGGTATATFNLPTLAPGVKYLINANYNPGTDTFNTATQAAPITVAVPGTPVTVTVTSTVAQLTFIYGSPAPVPVGTVTPTPPSPITYTFGSAAKATTGIGSYPVVVSFSGAGACAYGFPPASFSTGGAAVVVENPAPLTYAIPNFSAQYGAPNISYGANAVITGAVNGDGFGANFTPAQSSLLTVAGSPYSVIPTVIGPNVGNYTVTAKPSTLTVSKAGTAISASLNPTAVLNTTAGVTSVSLSVSVSTTVSAGSGTPSGTVIVSDAFTPITATGLGTPVAPVTTTLTLSAGAATYPPTGTTISTTPGLHQYSFSYSGDSNFQTSTLAPTATAAACTPSALSANCLLVDYPDFTLTSATGPIVVIPGVVPSGNGLLPAPNQSTAAPETAVLFINGVLAFSGQVTLSCAPQSPSYVTCFMTPPAVSVTSSAKTAATVVAIETPATLPLGFKTSELRTSATRTVLAFLPLGVLAFCVRRRRRLSKALWTLMIVCAIGAGMTGCGGNQIDFYTPIPTGPQTVTVNATWIGNATQPAGTRSFVVPITID